MVLYTAKPCFEEWNHGPPVDAMVLYTPNLVLTSGMMVRTINGSLHPKPCFDEWPDGPHHQTRQWFSTPQTLF